jgi:hypothetical protein
MSGEVAGLAASMSAESGVSPAALPVRDIQAELRNRNFLLDVRERMKSGQGRRRSLKTRIAIQPV